MELFSGMAQAFQSHYRVEKFEWNQDESCGKIGVADGDPTDAGQSITVEHVKDAWKIVAEESYPDRVPGHMTKVGRRQRAQNRGLKSAPQGVYMPAPGTKPTAAPKE